MSQPTERLTILVVRTGGFAGIRRAWRVLAEGAEIEAWTPLIDACPWDAVHAAEAVASSPAAGADRFAWEVAAARGDADQRALLSETDAAGPWRELIDRVRADGEPVPPHAA